MCGIFAFFAREKDAFNPAELTRINTLLAHRGRDDCGAWYDKRVFLGHNRLSILDLNSRAKQPMFTEDNKVAIIFNGEIYNYIELRDTLSGAGFSFRTSSDTEVILNGYRHWGTDLPTHLQGMFAFVIYNSETQSIFTARDRFGEKPLFIYQDYSRIIFSSELKAIALCSTISKNIDYTALMQYLSLNYVPGEKTLFQEVEKVRPGTWKLYSSDMSVCTETFWQPHPRVHNSSCAAKDMDIPALKKTLKNLIDHSVRGTLRSDVPVTLFLSGGMDSSLIAESAVRQGGLQTAFCLDFREKSFSEYGNAKYAADKLNLKLERVFLEPDVLEDFFSIAAHLDDPLADSSALAVWTLAKTVGKQFKVALSGDGGDELFAGYLTYKASLLHHALRGFFPNHIRHIIARLAEYIPQNSKKVSAAYKVMRFLRAFDLPVLESHFTWNGSWLPREAKSFLSDQAVSDIKKNTPFSLLGALYMKGPDILTSLQLTDIANYLANDILPKVDRMTMAWGLETRAPFSSS